MQIPFKLEKNNILSIQISFKSLKFEFQNFNLKNLNFCALFKMYIFKPINPFVKR